MTVVLGYLSTGTVLYEDYTVMGEIRAVRDDPDEIRRVDGVKNKSN